MNRNQAEKGKKRLAKPGSKVFSSLEAKEDIVFRVWQGVQCDWTISEKMWCVRGLELYDVICR